MTIVVTRRCPNQQTSLPGGGSGSCFTSGWILQRPTSRFQMRHAQGFAVWDTSLGKKRLPLPPVIYSYRGVFVSESEHPARSTTAHLGCDGRIFMGSDQGCFLWRSLLMDSWQQKSEVSLTVTRTERQMLGKISCLCISVCLCEVWEDKHEQIGIFADHIWITKQ